MSISEKKRLAFYTYAGGREGGSWESFTLPRGMVAFPMTRRRSIGRSHGPAGPPVAVQEPRSQVWPAPHPVAASSLWVALWRVLALAHRSPLLSRARARRAWTCREVRNGGRWPRIACKGRRASSSLVLRSQRTPAAPTVWGFRFCGGETPGRLPELPQPESATVAAI